MGAGNMALWSKLNVAYNKNSSFSHPCDSSLKIIVHADVPHLIKLARNHLFDQGFIVENSGENYIINIDYSELTLAHKLTEFHLNVKGSMRQRVRPARRRRFKFFRIPFLKQLNMPEKTDLCLTVVTGRKLLNVCSYLTTGSIYLIPEQKSWEIVQREMGLTQL